MAVPATPAPPPRAQATANAAVPTQPDAAPSPAPPEDLAELWVRLLEAVGRVSPFTRTYLLEAHPVSFQKNLFTIGFDPEFEDHLGLVDNARNHTLLQTKLLELGHPNTQIKFIKATAPEKPAAAPAEPTAPPAPSLSRTAPVSGKVMVHTNVMAQVDTAGREVMFCLCATGTTTPVVGTIKQFKIPGTTDPFPVPLEVYDQTISVLRQAVARARLGNDDRLWALARLDAQARSLERAASRARPAAFPFRSATPA